eukprot:TRINITY_DN5673_c0_g1_i5.p1 TRINITY_DN5673_c0_g1~~TRINITY_DN5673_c0_g1_i5.p1  ORF type:complete len:843 (-),score=183.14 TRINITY_DN5673_c0_g1_i5:19-2547(-)
MSSPPPNMSFLAAKDATLMYSTPSKEKEKDRDRTGLSREPSLSDVSMDGSGAAPASSSINLPPGDSILEDYSCAFHKDRMAIVPGRLFISHTLLVFQAQIFSQQPIYISLPEVAALHKRNTAYVFPNAIEIVTATTKFLFTSFFNRDHTFATIWGVWRGDGLPVSEYTEDDRSPSNSPRPDHHEDGTVPEVLTSSASFPVTPTSSVPSGVISPINVPAVSPTTTPNKPSVHSSRSNVVPHPSALKPESSFKKHSSKMWNKMNSVFYHQDGAPVTDRSPNGSPTPTSADQQLILPHLPLEMLDDDTGRERARSLNTTLEKSASAHKITPPEGISSSLELLPSGPDSRGRSSTTSNAIQPSSPVVPAHASASTTTTTATITTAVIETTTTEPDPSIPLVPLPPVSAPCEHIPGLWSDFAPWMTTKFDLSPIDFYLQFVASDFWIGINEQSQYTEQTLTPWIPSGHKPCCWTRSMSFRTPISFKIGPKSTRVQQTQRCVMHGDELIIETSSVSKDVPYGDCFTLDNMLLIAPTGHKQCEVRISSKVKFSKSVWGMGGVIEKNAIGGNKDFWTLFVSSALTRADELAASTTTTATVSSTTVTESSSPSSPRVSRALESSFVAVASSPAGLLRSPSLEGLHSPMPRRPTVISTSAPLASPGLSWMSPSMWTAALACVGVLMLLVGFVLVPQVTMLRNRVAYLEANLEDVSYSYRVLEKQMALLHAGVIKSESGVETTGARLTQGQIDNALRLVTLADEFDARTSEWFRVVEEADRAVTDAQAALKSIAAPDQDAAGTPLRRPRPMRGDVRVDESSWGYFLVKMLLTVVFAAIGIYWWTVYRRNNGRA